MKPTVLILCTGNSCRSHMAEGILRAAAGDILDVQSAGSEPAGHVHPLAIAVMREIGIDISGHRSKSLREFLGRPVETVITVCGNADQACPTFPGQVNRHHWPFDDPAKATGSEEERLTVFRRVRDEIRRVFEAYAAGRRDQLRAGSTRPAAPPAPTVDEVRETVRAGYAQIATGGGSCCGPATSCGCDGAGAGAETLARQLGYQPEELAALPEGANLGLSCGNPTALAGLRPGEVVLDLGSGAGFDVFLAGRKVGPTGRAIGVDMTPEMVARARAGIPAYRQRTGWDNVEFRLGEIEHLPVADASVDVVISNCVINLSPDKARVWREIARVLKPGGRVAVSDLALLRPLPPTVVRMVEALVGCVAGAVLIEETERMIREAGLDEVQLRTRPEYVQALESFEDPLYRKVAEHLPPGTKVSDYLVSLEVTARKPERSSA
ncbi:arsenite methyltransferase [Limisphaera sp. VF-2]|uniref:arsenite methyltransferase n=1 Tax=Limisphaera sp. VF-2 TaxID=3400418 RepID=UPI00175E051C